MSIASEINRISGNIADALDEVSNKGVTVPSGSNSDDLASLIRQISGGDGYVWQDQNGYVHLSDEQGTQTIIDALTVSGAGTSTAPTGHAYSPVTVPSGSASTPATSVTANPTISVSSGGLITATASATKSVTPSVSAGWVASGTAGTITVSGSNTSQLSTEAGKTVTPTTSEQTAVASGKYTTGAIKVAAMPSGTAGTPNIQLDGISNHVATLYPWVQNTTGYITGGTKTGSAYTISASQLTSGTKSITENGTGIDVTNYKYVDVDVPIPDTPREKQINFIDYDGTLLYSYDYDEWMNVTSLPNNPSHDGLTAQGWNWTKTQIDDFLNEISPYDKIWVGQTYITNTQATRIYISLEQGRLHPYLGIAPNGTVIVDWGDDTSTSTITGTSLTTVKYADHEYEYDGMYTITLSASSGTFALVGNSTVSYTLRKDTTSTTASRVYANAIRKVELGNGVVIGDYAFYNCYSLESITIPNNITSIGSGAFYGCYSLASVTIPSDVTSIAIHTFRNCYSLARIAIPYGMTSFGNYTFYNCYSLVSITLPTNMTSIGTYAFSACNSLTRLSIPLNVNSISSYLCDGCVSLVSVDIYSEATIIGNYAFRDCCSLANVSIPPTVETITTGAFSGCYSLSNFFAWEDVTAIVGGAFENCYGMGEYHFYSYTPPTLGSGAFSNIQSDCKIYVPRSRLSTYRTATNWSSYSAYMVGEE